LSLLQGVLSEIPPSQPSNTCANQGLLRVRNSMAKPPGRPFTGGQICSADRYSKQCQLGGRLSGCAISQPLKDSVHATRKTKNTIRFYRTPATAAANEPLEAGLSRMARPLVTWVDRAQGQRGPAASTAQLPLAEPDPVPSAAHGRLPHRRTTGGPQTTEAGVPHERGTGGRGAIALRPPDEGDRGRTSGEVPARTGPFRRSRIGPRARIVLVRGHQTNSAWCS
jgi:hypothetical protein